MYDNTAISSLIRRVGWRQAIQPNLAIVIDATNIISDSGRYFNDFHKLAIVENAVSGMPNAKVTSLVYNEFLYDMKKAAVLKVLSAVFDINPRANYTFNGLGLRIDTSNTDYTNTIITRSNLFDEAIGYQVAYDTIELMLLTGRSNMEERLAKMNFNEMKIEMGDFYHEGELVGKGILGKLNSVIERIIDILFPKLNDGKPYVNAVNKW